MCYVYDDDDCLTVWNVIIFMITLAIWNVIGDYINSMENVHMVNGDLYLNYVEYVFVDDYIIHFKYGHGDDC